MKLKIEKKLVITIIVSIVTCLMLVISGTLAYYKWNSSNNIGVDADINTNININYLSSNTITGTLNPSDTYFDGSQVVLEFWQNPLMPLQWTGTITLDITTIDNLLITNGLKWAVVSNDIVLANGDFVGSTAGQSKILYTNFDLNNYRTAYSVYIWLDSTLITTTSIEGLSFTGIIKANATQTDRPAPTDTSTAFYRDSSNANPPALAEGMIPVMYNGTSWVKADYYDSTSEYAGYDYQNKKWANAVMVTNATRNTYMNANAGEPVLESDILAYFVWIPRYKYELFNPTYASGTSPQLINVLFELETSTTGTVICTYDELGNESCTNKTVGNYYTHPAFTFGNTKLTGIWVGKFETTGIGATPTIKPNASPLLWQNVSTQFATAKILGTNTYLTDNGVGQTDSHMMKNIEWGAVAYLKQSTYGLGTINIGTNNYMNSDSYMTGCGAVADSPASTTCNQYNTTNGMLASTTGNIYGVYDMSGGAWEYVMGNYQKYSGYTAINYTVEQAASILGSTDNIAVGIWNSGFNGPVYGKALDGVTPLFVTNGVPFPENKYYDLYAESGRVYSHLGDATGETAVWYSDDVGYINSIYVWYVRGHYAVSTAYTGTFSFSYGIGSAMGISFRSVLVIE